MKPERTLLDAEQIRTLMIGLQVKIDSAKHKEAGRAVLDSKWFKRKITHIAVHNTSETYPVVKEWVEELTAVL